MQRDAGDYAAKAEEMRRRASQAASDTLRAMYLESAKSYENLATRGVSVSRADDQSRRIEALESEVAELKQLLVAVDNALVICVRMLRKNVAGFSEAVDNMNVEPHPDTPASQVEPLRRTAMRIRRIFGQVPGQPPAPEPAPTPTPTPANEASGAESEPPAAQA